MLITDTRIAHTDAGTGEPALFYLPGWCGGREVFDPVLAETAAHRRSVSMDLPGHGENPSVPQDFGTDAVVAQAESLLTAIDVDRVVPVTLAHAGWVAIELRRRLGAAVVSGVVLLDWMPLGTPPGFAGALAGLQDPAAWSAVRAQLFDMWGHDVDVPAVHDYIASMGRYGFDMWGRAGREISAAFAAEPMPLAAFAALPESCPVLHLFAQPRDDGYLAAQQDFAAQHTWFHVERLDATSHFPSFEVRDAIASSIETFVEKLA
jgi:hypothetical protein